ncbi:MAG TPA: enoyl-CoA hydratase/isomerase family protein, partial [Blastocatellia bacterium]|nr:enoyl-CoA hydratase/isomerase family protein [Blastocatellia bacterium]
LHKNGEIATLMLNKGKVNALNGAVLDQLRAHLEALENDREVRAVILTGSGKFFSFGFAVPEFLSFTKEQFAEFVTNFTDLYAYLFLYPKPVVAALNGHAIAGGCVLALTCDYRVMVDEKAKIALNEISFGSAVFAGIAEMLRFCVGSANAARILYSGTMYTAQEAKSFGLVDEATTEQDLMTAARKAALDLGSKNPPVFVSVKSLLRKPVAEEILRREAESIRGFIDIWYSEATWANLQNIEIH